jgi:hypothetical protein
VKVLDVETPHGPARVHLDRTTGAWGGLVLGHGAGGGVGARDLVAAAAAAKAEGLSVALVEQPYRVAGRRSPAPAHQLDTAWIAVLERLKTKELRGLTLIAGAVPPAHASRAERRASRRRSGLSVWRFHCGLPAGVSAVSTSWRP